MNIYVMYGLGQDTWWGEGTLLKTFAQRSLTDESTFISGSVGCENVYM